MSKIEKLIKEKCPNGVEYKKLKEICNITTGKLNANKSIENGEYPFFTCGKDVLKIDKYAFDCEALLISGNGANVGIINYYKGKFNAYQRTYVITNFDNNINVMYIKYVLDNYLKKHIQDNKKDSGIPYIVLDTLTNFEIPLPPLEIQNEIVKILDKFSELEEKLEEELEERKKQYEFWRGKLIGKTISKKFKLKEIASVYDGTHTTPDYQLEGIPFISVENINDIYNSKKHITKEAYKKYKIKPQLNDVFMTRIGSIGTCAVFEKSIDLAYYVSLALIRPNNKIIDSRYLKYFLESSIGQEELLKKTLVQAVPIKINKDDIGKIHILVPNVEEQKSIVNVLNRFDKLINDITVGIPAEIELRKNQYEHYRNKLLDFKRFYND
jgi:type I restriction enzyme S subunit